MKLLNLLCLVPILGFTGCTTSFQLKDNTLHQGASLTDLQYEMVLDNIAMFTVSPDALPWHAIITKGSITINDIVTPSGAYKTGPSLTTLSVGASRAWQGDWTFTPIIDGKILMKLRNAYLITIADTSWFHVGVPNPASAAYSGHYGKTFVWVDKATDHLSLLATNTMRLLTAAAGNDPIRFISLGKNNVPAFSSALQQTQAPPGVTLDAVSPFLLKQLPGSVQSLLTSYKPANDPNLDVAYWLAPVLEANLNKALSGWTTNDVYQFAASLQMSTLPPAKDLLTPLKQALAQPDQPTALLQLVVDTLTSYYGGILNSQIIPVPVSSQFVPLLSSPQNNTYFTPGPTLQIR